MRSAAAGGLSTLKRTSMPDEIARILSARDDTDRESMKIRCPRCEWQPRPSDRWCCIDVEHPEYFHAGCGTMWNTFSTHGRCPGCSHQWRWTSCFVCDTWSPHEDWYEKD
jgi:DNA-directed RNA polymerase subunit RPC12/RpoP